MKLAISSTIPFLFILYVLFVELTKSLAVQPVQVRRTLSNLRWLLLLSWGVYPIAYLLPSFARVEEGHAGEKAPAASRR